MKRKHLSKLHRRKISISKTGLLFSEKHKENLKKSRAWRVREHHPRWKGGRSINNDGYVIIWTHNGLKREHRLKMEKKIGRKLKSSEEVHHKNRIKTDNRLSNLLLMTKSEHMKYHARR